MAIRLRFRFALNGGCWAGSLHLSEEGGMDMKQSLSDRLHLHKRTKGETAQLAAQLAPLEEQKKQSSSIIGGANQEIGAIVIENSPVNLSTDISEARRGKTFMGMEPVV